MILGILGFWGVFRALGIWGGEFKVWGFVGGGGGGFGAWGGGSGPRRLRFGG